MSTINKVVLLGNVGKVEVKSFDNGRKLVQISLATQDGYKKANGDWENKTEWHRCIFAIPNLAEKAATLQQGDKIYLEGSINTNSWTTKDGDKKEIKEIACTMFKTFAKAANKVAASAPQQPVSAEKENPFNDDSDVPF